MSNNLASLLTTAAEKFGDRPAVRLDDTTLTYSQLDDVSARVAGLLQSKGISAGDRVGIMLPNVPYFPVAYYGILRHGCPVVRMNVLLKGRETTFYLQDPEAKAVFAWHDFLDSARIGAEAAGADLIEVKPGEFEQRIGAAEALTDVAEVDAQDTAVILYTSGTTGSPQGAQLTHASLRENVVVTTETLIEIPETDVILGALPPFP